MLFYQFINFLFFSILSHVQAIVPSYNHLILAFKIHFFGIKCDSSEMI